MATQEKLQKSLEALKNLSQSNQTPDVLKKKEKVLHCHIITESISNASIKVSPNFQHLLGLTIEALLKLCDDQESDVRMTSEECLNRIIRATSTGNLIQIELHKEIKRNGAARSLRAAIWRFSLIAHLIRPLKGKAYVDNLFPSLQKVAKRSEEQIHETLAISVPKIMASLGSFSSDNEIQSLLGAFLNNITHTQAVIRRSAATCVLNICLYCRKPFKFVNYTLNYILDLLTPLNDNTVNSSILGVMNCVKVILPYLSSKSNIEMDVNNKKNCNVSVEKLLEVYEICLYYLSNKDHNVVNAALEALNVLLLNCTEEFMENLLSKNGIAKNKMLSSHSSLMKLKSPSQLSVATNVTSTEENRESELTETLHLDIEKWIDESKLSVMNENYAKPKENFDKSMSLDTNSSILTNLTDDVDFSDIKISDNYASKSQSFGDNLDNLTISENSSEKNSCVDENDAEDLNINIGDFWDKDPNIIYCARLIVKSFLLTGVPTCLVSDKVTRVSVKSLALTCLSSIVKLYPSILLIYLDKNVKSVNQEISDIFLFGDHPDPQLRGVVRTIISNFVKTVIVESNGNYMEWINANIIVENKSIFYMEKMVQMLTKGLEDESANCSRQTIISLSTVLPQILESKDAKTVLPILRVIPTLAKNPYWLVKVALCELVSKLPYITIHYVQCNPTFQNKIIHNVLFEMLADNDQRVRKSAANAIIDIIPYLYNEHFQTNENIITRKAMQYKNHYLANLNDVEDVLNLNKKHFIKAMPFPFDKILDKCPDSEEYTLSLIVNQLYKFLLSSTSKHLMMGCFESLCLLSNKYPSTVYKNAWILSNRTDEDLRTSSDLLDLCISFLNTSVMVYDINCQINMLELASNLFAGQSVCIVRPIPDLENSNRLWDMFEHDYVTEKCELYFSHVIKLLNIFHHVINDLHPSVATSKTVLPSLPSASNLSPIKRRKSDLDKKMILLSEKDDKVEKSGRLNVIAAFAHLPHYLKIYEVLKSSYTNYKVTLSSDTCERFLEVMRKSLKSVSVLMEVGTLTEFGRVSQELLNYLMSTFLLDPTSTVTSVQQMLKCMFGTNLTANISEILHSKMNQDTVEHEHNGFYHNLAQKPYNEISWCINLNTLNKIDDGDNTLMGYLHRKDVKKQTSLVNRSSDKTLANYIRIFEPMVIKSLKQYTITSDVKLQCQVLQLLSQLVQLRVNYCLLDSEQVFIGFVLKQFKYIEEDQIPLSAELIPNIFQFLVQLSYGKQHSKSIIGIPKIIQLCNGLLASGQPPLTHCVPALQPIVEDIFLTRNKSNTADMKDLETAREVVLSNLLKLIEYKEVVDLLVLILEDSRYCSDDPDKWQRWSEQIGNAAFAMLKSNRLRLDCPGSFSSLRKLVFSLNTNVFQPVDGFILMLYEEPPIDGKSRWLSKIIILLLILSPLKEEVLISKISNLKANFSPFSIFENVVTTVDPLHVVNSESVFQKLSPEVIFVKFVFRVIHLISEECIHIAKNDKNDFLIKQFSVFLIYCLHIFQSGSHCKITNVAISIINQDIPCEDGLNQLEKINNIFLKLSVFYPILTFKWCYLLTLWNYKNVDFWSKVLKNDEVNKNISLNSEITKTGAVIVFCDFLIENLSEIDILNWILTKNIKFIIKLYNESPVTEFIYALNRNPFTSNLFIKSVEKECGQIDEPIFITTLLKCVSNAHSSQCGNVLHLLLTKFLTNKEVTISRNVAHIASRNIDLLLTMFPEEVNNQLPKEKLLEIRNTLITKELTKKHESLVSLLNKLSNQFHDLTPIELEQRLSVNPEEIKTLEVNKNWYLSQIRGRYGETQLSKETAELLKDLEYSEIYNFMSSKEFNKKCIKDCIRLAVRDIRGKKLEDDPDILKASVDSLLKDVRDIGSKLPKPHQVYNPADRAVTSSEVTYSSQMTQLFKNEDFFDLLHSLTPSLSSYITSLPDFKTLKIPDNNFEDIIKFGVILLESINFLIGNQNTCLNVSLIDKALHCSELIFKENRLCGILASDSHISWLSSAVNSLYKLVNFLLLNEEPLPSIPKYSLTISLENIETSSAGQACHQLYVLVSWLDKIKNTVPNIPKFLLSNVRSVVVSLSRMSVVNSYVLIPTKVWKTGWEPKMSGTFFTQVPPLPIELLQEIDILEEYIFRITLLGWTSRQQFEETWMCLLSVCNPIENCDSEEISDIVHGTSLAIKAITSLLLNTLQYPNPSNAFESKMIHVSRNMKISDEEISVKKLKNIQNGMQQKYAELAKTTGNQSFVNVFDSKVFEKLSDNYSNNQLSIRYFLLATNIIEECDKNDAASQIFQKRKRMLEDYGLDLTSCLRFLLDYYSQIMKSEVLSHIRVLYEAVRSTLILSDLFTEKSQFQWMLDLFLDLSKSHTIEDDLVHQYLIIGVCKSASILIPDLDTFETIKKLLVQYLKYAFIPSRIACLCGILYILEGCKLNNISIGGISDEMQIILPCVVEYIQVNLKPSNSVLIKSQDHSHLVWSIAFYLIENIDESHMESNFVMNTLQTAFLVLQEQKNSKIYNSIIKGLERLIIVKKDLIQKIGKQILNLALENMKHDNTTKSFLGTQLLITYMYTDCSDHLEKTLSTEYRETNPDHLVQTIEKISAIFEKIKKGYDFEVEILTSVLPTILDDFFAPSDVLTKVIGEFLSPQQPHPKRLSRVVFEVFGSAIKKDQLSLLQDWVVFSLSNFTQSFSIGLATWCLTCFFISASSNRWLRSYFPYVQTRVGRYEYEDRKMLCIAGADFYRNLTDEKQKNTFVDNFRKVKDKHDMPYNDLLNSL
ncbi:unnamed protein product [Brassicogethes aeneus]|uniref:Huntingtin n=1 Tax=Brassicogethes aeneus TaxID=1431903 RepID=A0A9P0FID0_BRAAE|nr:unnamed protein product [Brassicogethes aeneus]